MRKPHKSHTQNTRSAISIPQLSYDCRRRLGRAKLLSFHLYIDTLESNRPQLYIPYIFSYIHDDIEAIDSELISLGLLDEAMGKKRRK